MMNKQMTRHSQRLRREMTKEERHLWYDFLKGLPLTFKRQQVIGPCIVDFYCNQAKLVLELDGSQHNSEEGQQADYYRDQYLNSLGLTVLRYSNDDIHKRFQAVCEDILRHVGLL